MIGKPPEKPLPKSTKKVIETQKLSSYGGGGYTFACYGEAMSGKTCSILQLGYLNMKYIDKLREAGLNTIVESLRNGSIPEVTNTFVIESENSLMKQWKRPLEQKILGDLIDTIEVFRIRVVIPQTVVVQGVVQLTEETVSEIQDASDEYIGALNFAKDLSENYLKVLDSASRLKWLLEQKFENEFSILRDSNPEFQKNVTMAKFGKRNAVWRQQMATLRGMQGFVGCTFMEVPQSDWVIDMMKEKKKPISETKIEWIPATNFNFDMIFHHTIEPDRNISVEPSFGRYVRRGQENVKFNKFYITGTKFPQFSFLTGIENMLNISEGR